MTLLVAFASDNKEQLTDNHFGDAKLYLIYKISKTDTQFVGEIKNTARVDKQHGNKEKAKKIITLLKENKIQIAIAKNFGNNISQIKSEFVCILVKEDTIVSVIEIIIKHLQTIYYEWLLGENRGVLNFKNI